MLARTIGVVLLASIAIISCDPGPGIKSEEKPAPKTDSVNLTSNENKGLKEILALYGGHCKYSVGLDKGKKYFEIELSESPAAEQLANIAEMPASNMAYLFFKELKEDAGYDEILSTLVFSDGEKKIFRYSREQLALVTRRIPLAYKIAGLIKEKNYESLKAIIQENAFSVNKNEIISKLKLADSLFGNVSDGFKPYGFDIKKADTGTDLLHISGIIVRDKQSHEYSIDLDLNATDDKIFLIQFKL